jgi:hypothetical protein
MVLKPLPEVFLISPGIVSHLCTSMLMGRPGRCEVTAGPIETSFDL